MPPSPGQLALGVKVEREHAATIRWLKGHPEATIDQAAEMIAQDHLKELPDYYTRLKAMETESMIESVINGQDPRALLDTLSDGSIALNRLPVTSEASMASRSLAPDAIVRTFFDAYGDLRFSSLNGVLINELTPSMMDLVRISDEAHTTNDLIELIGSYEGPVSRLYNEVLARRRRPQGPPDPHRSLVARQAAHKHASNREAAARKSAVSAVGKAAHKAVGKLNSRNESLTEGSWWTSKVEWMLSNHVDWDPDTFEFKDGKPTKGHLTTIVSSNDHTSITDAYDVFRDKVGIDDDRLGEIVKKGSQYSFTVVAK